jgi:hypothetical protein
VAIVVLTVPQNRIGFLMGLAAHIPWPSFSELATVASGRFARQKRPVGMAAQRESALSRASSFSQSDVISPLVVALPDPDLPPLALLTRGPTVFPIRARNRACRSLFALARRARAEYFCKQNAQQLHHPAKIRRHLS